MRKHMISSGLFLAFAMVLSGGEAEASGREASGAEAETRARAVVERFDSLLAHGSPSSLEHARALTTGTARRLFPLLAETRDAVAAVLDTARSRDTVLDVRVAEPWAAVKVRAEAVFTRPFLGMTSLVSVQLVHLYRDPGAAPADWRIADFEELADAAAPTIPRTGAAPGAGAAAADDSPSLSPFPVSRLAPARGDHARATRVRLHLTRRDGTPLPPLPATPWQTVVPPPRAPTASSSSSSPSSSLASPAVILEVTRATVRDSVPTGRVAARPDSLARYLASTPELDLTDKLLRTRAATLAKGSPHDVETARRIRRYVSDSFDYSLGATLFATSREAVRDMKGDCSEASVLTAALLRATGIPSRVMLGYASLGQGVWIGHAWVEAWLGGADGGWVGVDAALHEFPAGPHRVALVALSGREDMKAAATNLMLSTLNNLDIEIEGAWAGGGEIPLVEHPAARAEARKVLQQVMEGMGR